MTHCKMIPLSTYFFIQAVVVFFNSISKTNLLCEENVNCDVTAFIELFFPLLQPPKEDKKV